MHTRPNRKIRLVFLPLKDDLSKEPTKEFFFAKHEGGNAKILVLLAYYLHHFRSVLNTVPKTKTTLNYEINVWGCIVCNFVWLYDSIGFLIKDKEKRQILWLLTVYFDWKSSVDFPPNVARFTPISTSIFYLEIGNQEQCLSSVWSSIGCQQNITILEKRNQLCKKVMSQNFHQFIQGVLVFGAQKRGSFEYGIR